MVAQEHDGHGHGEVRAWIPPGVRRRRWALGLVLAGALLVGAGIALRWYDKDTGFRVPRPAQVDALAPELLAAIDAHVERARAQPRDPEAVALLGLLYASRGFHEEALSCYRRAQQLDPAEPLWPYHAALAELGAERHELGRESLAGVAARWPEFAPARFRRGVVALDSGELELARRELEAAVELAPESSEAHAALGDALLQGGDAIDAARELERALQIDPRHASARYMLGLALQRAGAPAEEAPLPAAVGAARRLMGDAWSDRAPALLEVADLLELALERLGAGAYEDALGFLELARRKSPDDGRVLVNLGIALTRLGRHAEARAALARAVEVLPEDYRPHLNLAGLELEAGQLEAALASAERASALSPQVAQAHALAGKALLALGRADEGLERLEKANGLEPRNLAWASELAASYLAAGRPERARAAFESIARALPQAWQPRADLVAVCMDLGDLAAARAALGEALELAPGEPALQELAAALEAAERK